MGVLEVTGVVNTVLQIVAAFMSAEGRMPTYEEVLEKMKQKEEMWKHYEDEYKRLDQESK